MIRAVIFDLDGLLADTEHLHCRAYQMTLREHGVELQAEDYSEHWVRRGRGIVDWVAQHGLNLKPDDLRLRKSEHYLTLLGSFLRPMEGAKELLNRLQGNLRIGLASSSYPDAIDGVIHRLKIANYFEVIVSGLDVPRVKPAPDIFLKTAGELGVEPAECVVLEDAEKGVIAARQAGMSCVAVPNDYTRHHDFSKATRICTSLDEITVGFLRTLERGPFDHS